MKKMILMKSDEGGNPSVSYADSSLCTREPFGENGYGS